MKSGTRDSTRSAKDPPEEGSKSPSKETTTRRARRALVRAAVLFARCYISPRVRGRRHFRRLKRPNRQREPTAARSFTRTSLDFARMRRDLHIIETRWLTSRPSRVSLEISPELRSPVIKAARFRPFSPSLLSLSLPRLFPGDNCSCKLQRHDAHSRTPMTLSPGCL